RRPNLEDGRVRDAARRRRTPPALDLRQWRVRSRAPGLHRPGEADTARPPGHRRHADRASRRRPGPRPREEPPVIARIALAAALAGPATGAAAVLADDHPAPKVPAVAPATTAPRNAEPPVKARDIAIDVTAPDPKGGPEWAIRRFTAAGPEDECAEL